MEDSPAEDRRFEFIEKYVLKTLKLKQDRWQKCISTDDNKQVILEFLDKPDQITLVVSLNAAGHLLPTVGFPASVKNKGVYFVKKSKTALTPDSMKSHLVYGDLSYAPLDQFSALVEEVRMKVMLTAQDSSPITGVCVCYKQLN